MKRLFSSFLRTIIQEGKFESNSPSLANHSIEARTHWTSAWSPFDKSGSRFFSAWSSSFIEEFSAGFLSTLFEQFPVCSCESDCSSVRC